MTTHPSRATGTSQCDLILAALLESPGAWLSVHHLYRISGSQVVHSRISDLRRRGHHIEQRSLRRGRTNLSSYRILPPA